MTRNSRRTLWAGGLAVVIDAATSLNVYLLGLNGDWSQLDWAVIFTGLLTAILVGLKELKDYILDRPDAITYNLGKAPSPMDEIL